MPRVKLKGRHWLGLWLLLFLGVAAAVVSRQRAALLAASRLTELREQRAGLESRRADLERGVGRAVSREVLVPKLERAGFRLPADSENIRIAVDSGDAKGRR